MTSLARQEKKPVNVPTGEAAAIGPVFFLLPSERLRGGDKGRPENLHL